MNIQDSKIRFSLLWFFYFRFKNWIERFFEFVPKGACSFDTILSDFVILNPASCCNTSSVLIPQ